MTSTLSCSDKCKAMTAWFIGVIGTFMIVGALTWLVVRQPIDAPDSVRAAERKKALTDLRADNEEALNGAKYPLNPAAAAKGNKVYLMPIARAMEVAAEEWKDAAAGRAKLIQRFDDSQKAQSFE
jgi:hypothetical protein